MRPVTLMKITSVLIDRAAERGFRRRALRRANREYMELLYGYVRHGMAHVCVFMPLEHTGTRTAIYCEQEAYDDCDVDAKEHHLQRLGTVHTHIGYDDAIFSEGDLWAHVNDPQDLVMGICAIEKRHTKNGKVRRKCHVAYWPGVLPLNLDYTNWNRGKEVA